MNAYLDTLRLIQSWRNYRKLNDPRDLRLITDLALVIRSRVKQ